MATRHASASPRIFVGCAGWAIPAAHRNRFGRGDSVLARYATRLDCVEINSTFYRLHKRETYARWADEVPAGFRFAVKIPRSISHEARLKGCGPLLDTFLHECGGLGNRLASLLLQLPPSLVFDGRTVTPFFSTLRRRWSGSVACEPRHSSWFTPRAEDALLRHGIARVAADPAMDPAAATPGGDRSLAYWRWHGSPCMYYSAYDDETLRGSARAVTGIARDAGSSWVVFDNTAHGHAVGDALRFKSMLAASGSGLRRDTRAGAKTVSARRSRSAAQR